MNKDKLISISYLALSILLLFKFTRHINGKDYLYFYLLVSLLYGIISFAYFLPNKKED